MTLSRLRAWIRKYGTFGVLIAAAILTLRLLWPRYRPASLCMCGLLLLFGGCVLFWPHSSRPSSPTLPTSVGTARPSTQLVVSVSPEEEASQDFITALELLDTTAARAALKAGVDPKVKMESEYTKGKVSAFLFLLGRQMGRNSAEEAPELNKLLLDHGADPNEADEEGAPPLVLMAELDYTTTLRYLLEHGADIHAKDRNRWTALHYAVLNNNVKAVALLLARGADVNVCNNDGETPLMLHNPRNAELAKDESNRRFTIYHPLDEQAIRRLKQVAKADEKRIIRMLHKVGTLK
jgi:hypothetical protein